MKQLHLFSALVDGSPATDLADSAADRALEKEEQQVRDALLGEGCLDSRPMPGNLTPALFPDEPGGKATSAINTSAPDGLQPTVDQPAPDDAGERRQIAPCPTSLPQIQRDEEAANDGASSDGDGCVSAPDADLTFLAAAWNEAADPPTDRPHVQRAELAKMIAVKQLVALDLVPQSLVDDVQRAMASAPPTQAPGGTVVPMARRTGAHLLYVVSIEIGACVEMGKSLDPDLLCVYASWVVRRLLDRLWMPPQATIARLRAALVRPDGRTAKGWQTKGRQRAVSNARHALRQAIEAHPKAAAAVGLRAPTVRKSRSSEPLSVFARAFRRRVHNLRDFAATNQVGGVAGYGSLSARGLREAGQQLLDRVHAGDAVATHVCLQVLSHLPSHTLQLLPVIQGGQPPDDAMAWLDLLAGTYNYRLFHLLERGARPTPGAEACYEVTSQIVSVNLSPFLAEDVLARARSSCIKLTTEQDLLGAIDLHPQADIAGGKGYTVTVRRLQESIPTHLLQAGLHRWPVALATTSQFLLSRGRPAYSVCRASSIMHAVNLGYELLGWPKAEVTSTSTLVGSFVTPRAEAVSDMLNGLADRADRHRAVLPSHAALRDELNAHACWTAAVMALTLALRECVTYEVAQAELASGIAAHVDDKHVHAVQGPAVPIAGFLRDTAVSWQPYCLVVATRLESLGDPASVALARRIREWVGQKHCVEPVFVVDSLDSLVGVGTRTWHDVLPPSHALQENFGRHFWPFRLMEHGVAQLAIDIVMRHQLDGMRPAGSNTARSRYSTVQRLRQAMDEVIASLGLRMPRAFGHD